MKTISRIAIILSLFSFVACSSAPDPTPTPMPGAAHADALCDKQAMCLMYCPDGFQEGRERLRDLRLQRA